MLNHITNLYYNFQLLKDSFTHYVYFYYYINNNINYIKLNNSYLHTNKYNNIIDELKLDDTLTYYCKNKKSYRIKYTADALITRELLDYILNYEFNTIIPNPILGYEIIYSTDDNKNDDGHYNTIISYLGPNYDNYGGLYKIKLKDIDENIVKINFNELNKHLNIELNDLLII